MNGIIMKIKSAKYIQDIDLKNEAGEVVVKFSCETPLNEMDTCYMFTFYFGEVYYEVSDEDFFIRKGAVSEIRHGCQACTGSPSVQDAAATVAVTPFPDGSASVSPASAGAATPDGYRLLQTDGAPEDTARPFSATAGKCSLHGSPEHISV